MRRSVPAAVDDEERLACVGERNDERRPQILPGVKARHEYSNDTDKREPDNVKPKRRQGHGQRFLLERAALENEADHRLLYQVEPYGAGNRDEQDQA